MSSIIVVMQVADKETHHKQIQKISKESTYTDATGNPIYTNAEVYGKGWIRVAVDEETGTVLGYTCLRHKVRQPETMVYFVAVTQGHQGKGIGHLLLEDIEETTPHKKIALKVDKKNTRAIKFYKSLGYVTVSTEEYNGNGIKMEKTLK